MHGREPMPRVPYKNLAQSNEMQEKLEMSTAEIGLSVRTTNCLEERGIFTVHDLLNCTRADLLSISNFGEKTLEEVYKALERIGFFRAEQPASSISVERTTAVEHAAPERQDRVAHA
jgi:DNA-directed RNA polymerase subunit alpha